MLKANNFECGIVTARPEQMYGWPGICRIKGNEILVSASERKQHVCPFGREVIIRSLDGGKTWQQPQEVYNSELDDRDANLLTMPDGTIILTWFTSTAFAGYPEYRSRANRITQKMRDELIGTWLLRSFDGGHTWETEPHRIPVGFHAGPSLLSDNSLIYLGHMKAKDGYKMKAFKSKDIGETWQEAGEIPCPTYKRDHAGASLFSVDPECKKETLALPILDENHVMELSHGKLMALFRTEKTDQYLYQSNSDDFGKTWTKAKKIPVWGFPPYLIRLQCGAILCSYGHRRDPWSIRAVLSYDEGKTWDVDNIITLYEWEGKPDMGYPISIEVEHGKILTVFYYGHQLHHSREFLRKIKGFVPLADGKDREKVSTPEGLLCVRYGLE